MFKTIKKCFDYLLQYILPERRDYYIVKNLDEESIYKLPKPREIHGYDFIHALFDYRDKKVKAIVWELKYRENTLPLQTIGKMMFDEIISIVSDVILFDANAEFVILPVPMTPEAKVKRGYNQTELITKSTIENDTQRILLYAPQWLTKIKDTPKQSHSGTKEERINNLKDSFEADERLESKYVFVIDDVITTGSTLSEIKNTLTKVGVKKVFAFTIAH